MNTTQKVLLQEIRSFRVKFLDVTHLFYQFNSCNIIMAIFVFQAFYLSLQYGIIHVVLRAMVIKSHGKDTWKKLLYVNLTNPLF